jgi:hypothetical protein
MLPVDVVNVNALFGRAALHALLSLLTAHPTPSIPAPRRAENRKCCNATVTTADELPVAGPRFEGPKNRGISMA